MNGRFLGIASLTLLLGSLYFIFTVGFFFFGWVGQYKYELFYFPSPVISTLDSLTATGRMLSLLLPVVVFFALLLTGEMIKIPSSKMLSTEHRHQHGDLPGAPLFKHYPTGILAVSAVGDPASSGEGRAIKASRSDFLTRLFPYDPRESTARPGRMDTGLNAGSEKSQSKARPWRATGFINKNIT